MKHRLSASRLGLARRCQYWARPDATWTDREPSREARLGTAFHAAAEAGISADVPPVPDYDAVDDDQVDTLERLVTSWWGWWQTARGFLQWQAERAVAWDVRANTARWLPRTEHRNYGELGDYEIPGTIDVLGTEGDGIAVVLDLKTGRQTVEAPSSNPQLTHNGAAAVLAGGFDVARVTYAKVSEESVYLPEPAEIDALSIEATADELATLVDSVATADPKPGPWCQWCPAKGGSCPETARAVEQVVEASALVRRSPISLSIQDTAHAAGMLTAVDAIETFIGELKTRLKAFADANGGIELPDGTVYARTDVTTERPDLSVEGASDALVNLGLQAAIKESTTWAEIKKVGGKDAEKLVRDALRKMGAVKTSVTPRYEAKARKVKAA